MTRFINTLCLALAAFIGSAAAQGLWWQTTSIYQIYPRSFQDSDGDGVGDIPGITSRLEYLAELGVGGIWLSPIYKSPMKDFGYDISDYMEVDPIFGTIEDFGEMADRAHDLGLKILMDFVPNHSSDEHEWFNKSLSMDPKYDDYYVWQNASSYNDSEPLPPNNWVSLFRGPAWTWRPERQQFYLHQFDPGQPDLNYRNPDVMQEMMDVLTFWMDQGCDGYRMDAVIFLIEDANFTDNPESGNTDVGPDDPAYYDNIYTQNLQETREILAEMYEHVKAYEMADEEKMDMVEAYITIEDTMEYYKCSDFPFNFFFITDLPRDYDREVTAEDVANVITLWMGSMDAEKTANWVLGNHDQWRVGSRHGEALIDAWNMISLTLPGVSITYQGEEIGMLNNFDISWEETVDPQGIGCGEENYLDEYCSRDPERTPFQWDDTKNAGFTTGDATWLPVNDNYEVLNVAAQQGQSLSHLEIFRSLQSLRKEMLFSKLSGDPWSDLNVLAFGTTGEDGVKVSATVVNFGDQGQIVDLSGKFHDTFGLGRVVVATNGGNNGEGAIIELATVTVAPKESFVMKLLENEDELTKTATASSASDHRSSSFKGP